MKHTRSGFSVLLVLLFAAALAVTALSYVRTSGFLSALARARQDAEYQYWAAHGLMQYACATMRTAKDVSAEPIFFGSWPTAQSPYRGVIRATVQGNTIMLTVQLMQGKTVLSQLTQSKALESDFLA